MKHVHLRDLDVARIGLGAMGMSHGYTGPVVTTPSPSAPFTAPSTLA